MPSALAGFWFWLAWLAALWTLSLVPLPIAMVPLGLVMASAYLAGHFLAVVAQPPAWQLGGRGLSLVVAALGMPLLAPHAPVAMATMTLLAAFTLVDPTVRIRRRWVPMLTAGGAALSLLVALLVVWPMSRQAATLLPLVGLAAAVVGAGWRQSESERQEGAERYEALLGEYRGLKRQSMGTADAARADERLGIARRLHDSVGHKLTALLMQLEAKRLQAASGQEATGDSSNEASGVSAGDFDSSGTLKRLAEESLEETRRAVTALSEPDLGSMPSLIRLIRNLEAESTVQVDFRVRHGALSVQLPSDAAVALYRAVQEALTNAMRHGASRKVEVHFEVPGGRLFRFEVSNEVRGGDSSEGFGLTSMRDRVLAAGGDLKIVRSADRFTVRGSFPIGQ